MFFYILLLQICSVIWSSQHGDKQLYSKLLKTFIDTVKHSKKSQDVEQIKVKGPSICHKSLQLSQSLLFIFLWMLTPQQPWAIC